MAAMAAVDAFTVSDPVLCSMHGLAPQASCRVRSPQPAAPPATRTGWRVATRTPSLLLPQAWLQAPQSLQEPRAQESPGAMATQEVPSTVHARLSSTPPQGAPSLSGWLAMVRYRLWLALPLWPASHWQTPQAAQGAMTQSTAHTLVRDSCVGIRLHASWLPLLRVRTCRAEEGWQGDQADHCPMVHTLAPGRQASSGCGVSWAPNMVITQSHAPQTTVSQSRLSSRAGQPAPPLSGATVTDRLRVCMADTALSCGPVLAGQAQVPQPLHGDVWHGTGRPQLVTIVLSTVVLQAAPVPDAARVTMRTRV